MLHATSLRSLRRLGFRVVAAGALVASVAAVASVVGKLPHGSSAAAPLPAPLPWGAQQAGYRLIDAPLAQALHRSRVRVAGSLATPTAVYSGSHSTRLRYDSHSPYGVFLLTVYTRRHSIGKRAVLALATGCGACSENRRVALGGGIRGALRAGGSGLSSVTWREHGRAFEVRGPAATFSAADAVAAARAVARANA